MKKTINWEDFNEIRHEALWSLEKCCQELCISIRTYYRWQAAGVVPGWAYRAAERATGRLTAFGWKGWYIENGVLYCEHLSKKHYWEPGALLKALFLRHNKLDLANQVDGVNRMANQFGQIPAYEIIRETAKPG